MENVNGRKWARTFLGIALVVSVIGNVAHTILADSHISLWLRVPGAVIWPVFAFGGIEILVRMNWARTGSHRFARFMVLLPVVPAAITSYEHLRSMLVLMGEREFIAVIGPAVVDGMMLGCTLVLLFTRPFSAPATEAEIAPEIEEQAPEIEPTETWTVAELMGESVPAPLPVPVSPAPRTRPSRGEISPALRSAISALIEGETPEYGDGASRSTVGRYAKVLRVLRDNPNAVIDVRAEKVKTELVDMLRSYAREVAPR